ncbi:hypothetical protein F0P96_12995 [Hymenobacter busanensis]|uniref:Uncharacterized protein n=1 Tax=Hymenobacter busanensis TaxID=2607656 RepID=A0A7L4ZUY3_9BACT|nr:hypothetical protein [Hymenobacter busanensis]KAA9332384.1 hypothetical protein F0P96_12995 [Hymenobacter busanensis]QHJ07279.1 hypothetical protein GUY19_08280 [Hymenobacter busanensis]
MLPPSCSIQFRPDLQVLVVRWPADAPFPQLQADFEAVLHEAQQYRAARWLLDVRRRDELTPDLAYWTTHDFFPRANQHLAPLPLRIAVLASPVRMAVYEQDGVQRDTLQYGLAGTRPYRLQLFGDEGEAVAWLRA